MKIDFLVAIIALSLVLIYSIAPTAKLQTSAEKTKKTLSEAPPVSKDSEVPQNTTEAKEIVQKATPKRPLKFKKFRAVVEINLTQSKDDIDVNADIKKMMSLARSITGDIKDINVKKLEGIVIRNGEEIVFEVKD